MLGMVRAHYLLMRSGNVLTCVRNGLYILRVIEAHPELAYPNIEIVAFIRIAHFPNPFLLNPTSIHQMNLFNEGLALVRDA